MLFPQCTIRLTSRLFVGMGDGTSRLPVGVRTHPAQTPLSFREDGVVEVTRGLEMGGKQAGLVLVHLNGQLDLKRRGGFRAPLLLFLPLSLGRLFHSTDILPLTWW